MTLKSSVLCGIVFFLIFGFHLDRALAVQDIPMELESWKGWVLKDYESELCPCFFNTPSPTVCAWPSELSLTLTHEGGTFVQNWTVYKESAVPLPGDQNLWPRHVEVNDQKATILGSNDRPFIRLPVGTHSIQGTFLWNVLPETIQIPPVCGLVSLEIEGEKIRNIYMDQENHLYIRKNDQTTAEKDSMDITVFRLFNDEIPMAVTTLVKMNVSGKPRDIQLENMVFKGFIPLSVVSALPVKIADNGKLTVRVRAGHWEISMEARSEGQMDQIALAEAPYGNEIWSFISQNHLRMVRLHGISPVDPHQTDLPESWKKFSSFVVKENDVLIFEQIKRGNPDPGPDILALDKTLWLDFDGGGWTVRDTITGTRSRESVFTMVSPYVLGRVTVDGKDRLITQHGEPPVSGIELLNRTVGVVGESRIESGIRQMPASGWNPDFQKMHATLNLPVGFRLLAIDGPDRVSGTWLGQWTLFDFFITLIIAVVIYKLFGILPGILALITIGICFNENGAPVYVWISVLASSALLKGLPDNKFRKIAGVWYLASVITLVCIAVPFMVNQARFATYPQLEQYTHLGGIIPRMAYKTMPSDTVTDEAAMAPEEAPSPLREGIQKSVPKKEKAYSPALSMRYESDSLRWVDPDALNQTGPGLPLWRWKTHELTWNGPVNAAETITVRLIPPWINSMLGYLRVLLTALLMVVVIDAVSIWKKTYKKLLPVVLALLLTGMAVPSASRAAEGLGFPSRELLEDLRQRLIEKPDCLPDCADIPFMKITGHTDSVTFVFDIHSDARAAVPLPLAGDGRHPFRIMLDGQPVTGIFKAADHIRFILVEPGIHSIAMDVLMQQEEEINISFPLKPRSVQFDSDPWEITGLDATGSIQSGIKLIRKADHTISTAGTETGSFRNRFDDFFMIERSILLGLDWRMTTHIRRISPAGTSAVVLIPLLDGESVLTEQVQIKGRHAELSLAADQTERVFESSLEKSSQITLSAMATKGYIEKWVLKISPVWHVEYEGIPVIHAMDADGNFNPQWQPWPGESLRMMITRPGAVKGNILTIDRCRLTYTPGKRFSGAALNLRMRSSKGGQHTLSIPADASLQKVEINEKQIPVNAVQGNITLPLEPGLQEVAIAWTQPTRSQTILPVPDISLNQPAVNVDITVDMPPGRWILWAAGPRMGPAVLFWTYVLVIILISVILGRIRLTPLSWRHWLLLGLGLTQIPVFVSLVIAAWFFTFGLRARDTLPEKPVSFNLMQVGLAGLTLAAMAGLLAAISSGLLGIPDMQISGNGSSDTRLLWTMDRIGGRLPDIKIISLNLYVFKLLMLAWSLWLAYSLVKWLRWAWQAFSHQGLWRKIPRRIKPADRKMPPPLEGH